MSVLSVSTLSKVLKLLTGTWFDNLKERLYCFHYLNILAMNLRVRHNHLRMKKKTTEHMALQQVLNSLKHLCALFPLWGILFLINIFE